MDHDDVLHGNPFKDPVDFVAGSASEVPAICTRCGALVGHATGTGQADQFQLLHADWHQEIDGR